MRFLSETSHVSATCGVAEGLPPSAFCYPHPRRPLSHSRILSTIVDQIRESSGFSPRLDNYGFLGYHLGEGTKTLASSYKNCGKEFGMEGYRRMTGYFLGILLLIALFVVVGFELNLLNTQPQRPWVVTLSGGVWLGATLLVRISQISGKRWVWVNILSVVSLLFYWFAAPISWSWYATILPFVAIIGTAMLTDVTDLIWLLTTAKDT